MLVQGDSSLVVPVGSPSVGFPIDVLEDFLVPVILLDHVLLHWLGGHSTLWKKRWRTMQEVRLTTLIKKLKRRSRKSLPPKSQKQDCPKDSLLHFDDSHEEEETFELRTCRFTSSKKEAIPDQHNDGIEGKGSESIVCEQEGDASGLAESDMDRRQLVDEFCSQDGL